jgi:peptidoglycan-associated lipoprotein
MKRFAILLLASLATACSTPKPAVAPAPPPMPSPAPRAAAPAPSPPAKPAPIAQTESPMQLFQRTLTNLNNKSIYFDYDQYVLKPDETSVIMQHAKLANAYPNDHITLQGNCDERGGSEYNLALGQRRADEVKQELLLLGVPASHIDTVSFGKEKPRELCHQENCWAQNRRADFVDALK